jgi:CO/xanthine dehydrogenase Mo-binding subunit
VVGPYRIPVIQSEIVAVYTNTATVSAYRGAGQPQGVFVIERMMDRVAEHLRLDPAEVRRINMLTPEAFPYDTGLINLLGGKVEYDSGDFIGTMDQALAAADYPALRARQAEARKQGRYVGIGVANYVELTGRGPWEGAGVRVEPDGRVTVTLGAPSQGQGHETVFAQICADQLGAPIEAITVLGGDTALIGHGIGTFASRIAVLAGNGVSESAKAVKTRILELAGDMLEASASDLQVEDGKVSVVGAPGHHVTFAQVAQHAVRAGRSHEDAPGLEAVRYFKAPKITYSNGTHVCALEVDIDTATIRILSYAVAHDCGRVINPMIVEGQIWGGLACGLGNALLEEHAYDGEGQLLTGSFMDYAMPGAMHIPDAKIVHQETPSALNPLGIKGAGEAGTVPVPAVIASAVEDALRPLGIRIAEHPLTPLRLWSVLSRA